MQNQATLSFKLPYINTATQEADPSAQTQETDSFILSPVTDGDDLRRVQALYEFAVCHDSKIFEAEWEETIVPYEIANKKAKAEQEKLTPREQGSANKIDQITKNISNWTAEKEMANQKQTDNSLKPEERTNAQIKSQDLDSKLQAANQQLAALYQAQGLVTASAGATKPGAKEQAAPTANSSPPDSVELERAKEQQIVKVLGGTRFIYWTDSGAQTTHISPCRDIPSSEASPPSSGFYPLGSADGFDFWTDQPRKVAQFMMFVIGSSPNTSGVHALSSNITGNSTPKAQNTPTLILRQH